MSPFPVTHRYSFLLCNHWYIGRKKGDLVPPELVVEPQDDSTKMISRCLAQEGAFGFLDLFPLFYSE